MSKNKHPEFHIQCSFYNWCITHKDAVELPGLDMIFAVPSGAHLAKGQGSKLVKEGLRRGVPDMILPVPRLPFHGLFIEIKVDELRDHLTKKIIRRAGTPTEQQTEYMRRLDLLGYKVALCFGLYEAKKAVLEYYNVIYGPNDFK